MSGKSERVIAAFTELASRYEATMDAELRELWGVDYASFVEGLVGAMPVDTTSVVLDVATGTARIPAALGGPSGSGRTVVGVDITPAMLAHGKDNVPHRADRSGVGLVCGSAMTLPFAEATFGAVTCGLGMHHLDVDAALREMHRVLKAGAKLILITVGAPPSWRSWWAGPLVKTAIFLGFAMSNKTARALAEVEALPNVHTPEEWLEILRGVGYSDPHTSVPFRGRRSWYPDSLMIIAEKGGNSGDNNE